MTFFLRAKPGQQVQLDYSLQRLAVDVLLESNGRTTVSLQADPQELTGAPFYLFPLELPPAPQYNKRQQRLGVTGLVRDGQVYRGEWVIRDATAEELALFDQLNAPQPQWIEFGLALASLPAVDGLLATVEAASRPLERMLSGGLLQAAQGDPRTFLAAWTKVVQHGLISVELIQLVAGLAGQYDLPATFVAALDP